MRKLIEETRRGPSTFRSRVFQDMIFAFNDAPNIHGKPESCRRKYRYALPPARDKTYEDSKVQDVHPTLIPYDAEETMVADKVCPRYLEKLTVLVVQGDGCCCFRRPFASPLCR
jgi:hypothetical protein